MKLATILGIILLVTLRIFAEQLNCPSGYTLYGKLCYKYEGTSRNWKDANQHCKNSHGGELVSWNWNDSVGKHLQGETHGQSAWIGLRANNDNSFYWMDGTHYTSALGSGLWDPGEPSTPSENCVEIDKGKGMRLNDADCGNEKPSLCKACSLIDKCKRPTCVSGPDSTSTCSKCVFAYKPSTNRRKCQKKCEFNNPCWPGSCSEDYLDNCRCSNGFQNINVDGKNHCQLGSLMNPKIEKCKMKVFATGGKRSDSQSNSSSTHCDNMRDFYGNFQPDQISYDLMTSFIIDVGSFPKISKAYQTDNTKFGVTDVSLTVFKQSIKGGPSKNSTIVNLKDGTNVTDVKDRFSSKESITTVPSLQDGDRLCLNMMVRGGGYMETKDTRPSIHASHYHEFDKTETNRKICYIMDTSKPIHSPFATPSSKEPLSVSDRITRHGIINVSFYDWIDPNPNGGDAKLSSGIEQYELSLRKLNYLNGTQFMGSPIPNTTKVIESSKTPVLELNLTSSTPTLFLLLLQVKDFADNLGLARRFILYDSSSRIETNISRTITVTSASPATNYKWQTHHNKICLSWKDYFYNKVYLENKFLDPIAPDPNINGNYDQESGELSVKGTQNVRGIVTFYIEWIRNDSNFHKELVPDILKQTHCKQIPLKDGETYILNLTAIDIVNNTCTVSRTLSIDRSVPHINNIWLIRDGYHSIFAHGNKDGDLTEIDISFDALDPHSGIQEIQWSFGLTESGKELMSKNISVNETETCDEIDSCICPSIGKCQITKYVVSLKGGVLPKGNHNRNYYFTIKVTNHARLTNIEHIQILVDTSPPEPGVVKEGPVGAADIDYTSSSNFMVHWQGFVDHESGIKSYRIVMAEKCLTFDEMSDLEYLSRTNGTVVYFKEVPGSEISLHLDLNFTGKYFTSVVALNNAVQLSEVSCSDGITRDERPPSIENITLANGRWRETLHCDEDGIWLLKESLSKIRLSTSGACKHVCENATSFPLPRALKEQSVNASGVTVEEFLCKYLDLYSTNIFLYLPSDHVDISWDLVAGESQIRDFEVGFGHDKTESTAPSLIAYQTTNKRTWFKRNHAGFTIADPFYIFVKAINQAGLHSVTTIGPIIIDETPPIKTEELDLRINTSHVLISWSNKTFIDLEEPEPVTSIFFQIESGGSAITPLFQWNQFDSEQCGPSSGGCIIYSVRNLQNKDTLTGREFRFALFVYNNAGHLTRTTTNSFKIPSKFPPGQGVILDIDPANRHVNFDTSIHTAENTLCVAWYGFKHHENFSLEIGVGNNPFSDKVYPFQTVPNNGTSCIQSTKFMSNIKYFVSLRATCTGGSTLSSSNGVIIINETELINSLKIETGLDCKSSRIVQEILVEPNTGNVTFDGKLRVGQIYYLHINGNETLNEIELVSSDAITEPKEKSWFEVIPLSEQPKFIIKRNGTNNESKASIRECRNGSYVDKNSMIHGHWSINKDIDLDIVYEAAYSEEGFLNGSDDSYTTKTSEFKTVYSTNSASIHVDVPVSQQQYRFLVRPCIGSKCFQFAASPPIRSRDKYFDFTIEKSTLDDSGCFSSTWTLNGEINDLRFFQWTISKEKNASRNLLKWVTELPQVDKQYNIRWCVDVPMAGQETMFICVKAYTSWDSEVLKCVKVFTKVDGGVPSNKIFEFDSSLASWKNTSQLLGSVYLGKRIPELLDTELDFGNSTTELAVASAMAHERNVTWYIMASKYVPASCVASQDCLTSLETSFKPYALFQQYKIPTNRLLFSCAYSNETTINREYGTETLDKINYCSDGFIIDTVNPTGGMLIIPNHNGYISDIRHRVVSWRGFTDNNYAQRFGYVDTIKHYTISAGTRPGGDDLHQKTKIGLVHSYIFDGIQNKDGINIFITVKATDFAELETSITSDLFILDSSPPSTGRVHIEGSISTTSTISSDNLDLQLSQFEDPHSGIDYFEIGIGNQNYVADLLAYQKYSSNFVTLDLGGLNLLDGMSYFAIVQAVNRAGLKSKPVSRKFMVDRTPPSDGFVCNGNTDDSVDLDFQNNTTHITGYWYGFYDRHTGIKYYRVGLGLHPFRDDIVEMVHVGSKTNIKWHGKFEPGIKYYILVESCNAAGLCSRVSSDGIILDETGPIPGSVRVGHNDRHGKYQAKNNSVHIQWTGFSDPESGIDHFDVCLGTKPDSCDIHPFVNYLLSSSTTKTGLNLPVNKSIYAIVKATNKIGMSIQTSSDAFWIDLTPPEIVEKPSIVLWYNSITKTTIQYDPSVLRVQWKYRDTESPLVKHHLTIKTSHEGHTPIEKIELGSADRITLSLDNHNWLLSGDSYHVVVTSCNAAGLCTFAKSTDVLIDATPPHQGGFTSDLKWENLDNGTARIFLSWHSFVDAESLVKAFFVTVSKNYSGSELSNGIVRIPLVTTTMIQNGTFFLTDYLGVGGKIFLSIWAQNFAGLNSSVARISVTVLSSDPLNNLYGLLEIEKHSCEIQYCSGDCTCAIVGKPCEKSLCSLNNTDIQIHDLLDLYVYWGYPQMIESITTSTACLAAHWNITTAQNNTIPEILRYEFSIGLEGEHFGAGVFEKDRIPWVDLGLQQETVYCLTKDMRLNHSDSYVFYVRAWLSSDFYQTFSSAPIQIDQTPPEVNKGSHVKDSGPMCQKDYDIIDWMDTITSCWENVFRESQEKIIYYTVALGTSVGVDDIIETQSVALQTSITLTNLTLEHGTQYFFTITAFNNVGLQTSLSSDGFLIDMDKPRIGVVFNTNQYTDVLYQSHTSVFSISWNGFSDGQSGIKSYFVALVEEMAGIGDIRNAIFHNTGLKTQHNFRNISMQHGKRYKGLVKAKDGAGHESEISSSRTMIIDTTAPEGFKCDTYSTIDNIEINSQSTKITRNLEANFTLNNLYRVNGHLLEMYPENAVLLFENGEHRLQLPFAINYAGDLLFEYYFLSPYSGLRNASLSIDSSTSIHGNISLMECDSTSPMGEQGAVDVQQINPKQVAVNVLVRDLESSLQKVLVGVGTTRGGLQILSLHPISGGNNGLLDVKTQHGTDIHVTVIAENHAGLRSKFYSHPITFDLTGPEIEDVKGKLVTMDGNKENITDKVLVVADIEWIVRDEESGLKQCYCSFGHFPLSEDVLQWTPTSESSCSSGVLLLSHGTKFYGNVRCVNNVELTTEKTSAELIVVSEPPSTENARVVFIPINDKEATEVWSRALALDQGNNSTGFTQSSLSELAIEWAGFNDINGVSGYKYRLLDDRGEILVDYTNTRKTTAVFSLRKGQLVSGKTYTAEVQALNYGGFRSMARAVDIYVDDREPKLTGHDIRVTQPQQYKLKVNWEDVFHPHSKFSCYFSVSMGTKEGQADIADMSYTKRTEAIVNIPVSGIDAEPVQEMFIRVECKYPTGMSNFAMYNHKINI